MGEDPAIAGLKERMRDFDYRIASLRAALGQAVDDERKVELKGEVEALEARREQLKDKLDRLEEEPQGRGRGRLRAEWLQDWDALVQDLEDRISRLV